MNHAIKAIAHENKVRRRQTFTPPQSTAHAAHSGLVLHRRAYFAAANAVGSDPDEDDEDDEDDQDEEDQGPSLVDLEELDEFTED
jgi:hypothetical protein